MKPKVSDIITAVCSTFEVDRALIMGRTRGNYKTAFARQAIMFLARELTGLSHERIGDELGRDHTTVIHACRMVTDRLLRDPALPGRLELSRAHVAAVALQRQISWAAAMMQPLVREAAE